VSERNTETRVMPQLKSYAEIRNNVVRNKDLPFVTLETRISVPVPKSSAMSKIGAGNEERKDAM
jgi:hypothetical protein